MKKYNKRLNSLIVVLLVFLVMFFTMNLIKAEDHVHNHECGYEKAMIAQPCLHEHTIDCHYVKAQEEVPCDHQCIVLNEDGAIIHHEDCRFTEAIIEQPCHHIHDEECGYLKGTDGQPCQLDANLNPTIDKTYEKNNETSTMTYTQLKEMIYEKTAYEFNENPQPIDLQGKTVIFEAGEYIGYNSYDTAYVPLIIKNGTFKRASSNTYDYLVYVTSSMGRITFENITFDNANIQTGDAAIKINRDPGGDASITIKDCTFKNFLSTDSGWGRVHAPAIYSLASKNYAMNIDGIRFENCYNNDGLLRFQSFFNVTINNMSYDGLGKSMAIHTFSAFGEQGRLKITNSDLTNCVEGIVVEGGQFECDNISITNSQKGIRTKVYSQDKANDSKIKNSMLRNNEIGVSFQTQNNLLLSGKTIIDENTTANLQLDAIDQNKVRVGNLSAGSKIGIGVIPAVLADDIVVATKDNNYNGMDDSLSYFYSDHDHYILTAKNNNLLLSESVTVTFDTNGGNLIAAQQIEKGGRLVEPNPPMKKGYHFIGWYTKQSFENTWNFTTDTAQVDMILYAKYEKIIAPTSSTNRINGVEAGQTGNNCSTYLLIMISSCLVMITILKKQIR